MIDEIDLGPGFNPGGKSEWTEMLRYVAALHGRSTHPAKPPFPRPWEEIGPGYASSPAFGHWDIIHQILDLLPLAPNHTRDQLLNNLVCQHEDGFLPGTIWMKTGAANWSVRAGHPPVWPVAVDEWSSHHGSNELLTYAFVRLQKQLRWFENQRQAQGIGFYYTDISEHRWESGVDEGIRFDAILPGKFACVDATSHVYQMYVYAAEWAQVLRLDNSEYLAKAQELQQFLSNELWDAETGWFYDAWSMEEPSQRRWALEGMWPVVVGAATQEQAECVAANLLDAAKFLTVHPLSSVALCDPKFELRMWRGGSWNSMTFWAARGLADYGLVEPARVLLEKALDMSAHWFQQTGTIWEFYHPHGESPELMARKPDTEFNTPFPDYLGHNPLLAMTRLYDVCRLEEEAAAARVGRR